MAKWRSQHENASAAQIKAHRDELYEKEQTWARQHQDLRRGHEDKLTQYEAKESRAMAKWRSQHENASAAQIKAHRDELHETEEMWARQHERLRLGHEETLSEYEARENLAMTSWKREHQDATAATVKAHRDEIHEREQEWMSRHETRHANSIKNFESAMHKIVKAAKKQTSNIQSRSERNNSQELQRLRDEHKDRLHNLRTKHYNALEEHREELRRVRNQSADSSTILRKHRDKIEDQRNEMQVLQKHRDRHEKVARSTKREADMLRQELHEQRRNSNNAMEELKRFHEEEKLRLAAERANLVREHRNSLTSVQDSHREELQKHRSNSMNSIDQTKSEMKQLQDKLRIYEKKVFQSRSTYQQQYGELMKNHEDSLSTLRDEHNRSLAKLHAQHEAKAKASEAHTQKVKAHFENRMASQEKDFNRRSILQRDRMSRSYSKIRDKLYASHKKEMNAALSRQRNEMVKSSPVSSLRSPKLKIADNGQLRVSAAKVSDVDDKKHHPAEVDLKKTLAALGFE